MTKPGKKFWNVRNATSLFSKDISTITWLPSLREHFLHWAQPALSAYQSSMALQAFFQTYLPTAEVGVDAVKDADHKKISFQSVALGSNFTFLFTFKSKRCNMTAIFQLMQIPNSGTPSLKCSMDKNESRVVLNNWTVLRTWLWPTMKLRWESNKDLFFWKATQLSSCHCYFYIILTSDYLYFS